jgi:hypothetical protein
VPVKFHFAKTSSRQDLTLELLFSTLVLNYDFLVSPQPPDTSSVYPNLQSTPHFLP